MASYLCTSFQIITLNPSKTHRSYAGSHFCVRCGRRDNRGPLLKGRILSTEAIQAVQALKRAHKTNPSNLTEFQLSQTLGRLIKADLISAFKELLRQGHCEIAVKAFSAVRSEYHPELSLYADLIKTLGKDGLNKEIDDVICELEKEEDNIQCDDKGLVKLIQALIGANRADLTIRIYGLLKRSGWGSNSEMDENVAKVLIRGLRRLGEVKLADEIDAELKRYELFPVKSRFEGLAKLKSSG